MNKNLLQCQVWGSQVKALAKKGEGCKAIFMIPSLKFYQPVSSINCDWILHETEGTNDGLLKLRLPTLLQTQLKTMDLIFFSQTKQVYIATFTGDLSIVVLSAKETDYQKLLFRGSFDQGSRFLCSPRIYVISRTMIANFEL